MTLRLEETGIVVKDEKGEVLVEAVSRKQNCKR